MLLALTLVASLHAASADSISGKWQLKGDVVGNPLNTICEISQAGSAITGVCSNDQGGPPQPITGEVKGDSVTFSHGGDYNGTALTIVYAAKIASPTKLEGTINVKPFDAAGTLTAEPVAAAAAAPKK